MNQAHTSLVNDILKRYSLRQGLTLWKLPTGLALSLDGKRKIKYGIVGGADIIGISMEFPVCPRCGDRFPDPLGRWFCCEVKVGSDKPKPGQENFRDVILSHGGIYIIAKDENEPGRYLDHKVG